MQIEGRNRSIMYQELRILVRLNHSSLYIGSAVFISNAFAMANASLIMDGYK